MARKQSLPLCAQWKRSAPFRRRSARPSMARPWPRGGWRFMIASSIFMALRPPCPTSFQLASFAADRLINLATPFPTTAAATAGAVLASSRPTAATSLRCGPWPPSEPAVCDHRWRPRRSSSPVAVRRLLAPRPRVISCRPSRCWRDSKPRSMQLRRVGRKSLVRPHERHDSPFGPLKQHQD